MENLLMFTRLCPRPYGVATSDRFYERAYSGQVWSNLGPVSRG